MPQAKAAKPKVREIHSSSSGTKMAEALVKNFPKDADRIVKVMLDAASNKSMKRKLARVQVSLESLRNGESQ